MKLTTNRRNDPKLAPQLKVKKPKKVAESATLAITRSSEKSLKERSHLRPSRCLSQEEKAQLRKLESILRRNEGKASIATARALHQINVNRLFRGHANSMKKYGALWNLSPAYTSRLVNTGEIYARLLPICRSQALSEPTSAWQLRPLISIKDPSAQETAWRNAVAKAGGRKLTAAMVESCALVFSARVTTVKSLKPRFAIDLSVVPELEQNLIRKAKRRKISLQQLILEVLARSVTKAFVKARRPRFYPSADLLPALFGSTRLPSLVVF